MHSGDRQSTRLDTSQYASGPAAITPDELQVVDDHPMEDAIHIVRGLVDLTTAGRLRTGSERRPDPPNKPSVPRQHQTPTERSDWNG